MTTLSLSRELVFLVLQFLEEENFIEVGHKLEQASGFYFNMPHFEEMVTNGEWDEAEKYLSGFIKVDDNRYSMKTFFEIRKQKYLEALDRKDRAKALDILVEDLKVFSAFNEDLYKEITQLLTLENFRHNDQLSRHGETKSARAAMLSELKKLIEANPLFRDKLTFPSFMNSRLRTLINQSLNWQHQLCKSPKPNPDIKTLFIDHSCGQLLPDGTRVPYPITNAVMAADFPPLGAHGNGDSHNLQEIKPRTKDESVDKSRAWKLAEINEPSLCRSVRLPDNISAMRVSGLIYTNSGCAILALAANAVHKLWKWQQNDQNASGKATASILPQLWQPASGILMTNDISDRNSEDAVPCFTLAKNDCFVVSTSGGKISLFNMMTFKKITTFMPPPPAASFLAFYPQDNNIVAIGMEDSSILIYNVRVDEVKIKLKGHHKRITGLAFSNVLNVLVSSGADSQLCVWSTDGWEKQTTRQLRIPAGRAAAPLADTRVQFHQDQTHLIAVQETQIAIYEAPRLECLKQWLPREASGPITHATYSCDSQSIYVSFEDGSVGVLTATSLRLRCRINPASYLPANPSLRVYPLVIAAHPSEPTQFALGLTDGGVYILEPLESEGRWGALPPENHVGPSTISGTNNVDQPQR